MAKDNLVSKFIYGLISKFLSIAENKDLNIGDPKKIIIIRQHNQLGDLLAGVSLFRAIKETYPAAEITLVVSPANYYGIVKNKYISRYFIFDKAKLFSPVYFDKAIKLFREEYDLAIVPVTVSVSFTSNLLARLANAKIRIGAKSLDGVENKSAFLFDRRVNLDWRHALDQHIAERILDIVRPFGINTNNIKTEISFDQDDLAYAQNFLDQLSCKSGDHIIGIHAGAGKIPNRWSLCKYVSLMNKLNENYSVKFYLTGSSADHEELEYITNNISFKPGLFLNKTIPQIAALISRSSLFITNDTGIMHVAGATDTPQISIFGPTNPYIWAPAGEEKVFLRRSELIDEVGVEEVYLVCGGVFR